MPNPSEFNLLTSVQFKFEILKLPETNFFVQNVILPSITLDAPLMPGPRRNLPLPGSKVEFDPLIVTFLVDEDLNNYVELYRWIMLIQRSESMSNWYSDANLHFLTGQMNTSRIVRFVNMVPTMLSELSMTTMEMDSTPVEATISFQYEYFDFPSFSTVMGTDNMEEFQKLGIKV
jgi:hypothetical protein